MVVDITNYDSYVTIQFVEELNVITFHDLWIDIKELALQHFSTVSLRSLRFSGVAPSSDVPCLPVLKSAHDSFQRLTRLWRRG